MVLVCCFSLCACGAQQKKGTFGKKLLCRQYGSHASWSKLFVRQFRDDWRMFRPFSGAGRGQIAGGCGRPSCKTRGRDHDAGPPTVRIGRTAPKCFGIAGRFVAERQGSVGAHDGSKTKKKGSLNDQQSLDFLVRPA